MTIASQDSFIQYSGNGASTVFPFTFLVPTGSLVVTKISGAGSAVIDPSNYTVAGLDDPAGGSVTYPLAGPLLASGEILQIQRILALVQTLDLTAQTNFYPDVIETELDYIVMLIQQVQGQISLTTGETGPGLVPLSPLIPAADKVPYYTGATTAALAS